LILLSVVCALIAGSYTDDRAVGSARRWWQLHDQWLDGVAEVVVKYNVVHGHYPDNNQGLQSMDTFDARFDASMEIPSSQLADGAFDPADFFSKSANRFFWRTINGHVRQYRANNGRPPQDAEELSAGPFFPSDWYISEDVRRVQVAISPNNCLYLLGPNCVYDPLFTPYGYENRNGLDGKLFAGSIANRDPGRNFSREVAPGVYVYSYNARKYYRTYQGNLLARWGRIFGFAALAFGLLVLAGYRVSKYGLSKPPLVFPALAAMLAFAASSTVRVTCYIPSPMPRRNPKDLAAQKQLLEKFHNSGVINSETYAKAMKCFEGDAVFVPPKKPEEGWE
jgi:hypothetical protein